MIRILGRFNERGSVQRNVFVIRSGCNDYNGWRVHLSEEWIIRGNRTVVVVWSSTDSFDSSK